MRKIFKVLLVVVAGISLVGCASMQQPDRVDEQQRQQEREAEIEEEVQRRLQEQEQQIRAEVKEEVKKEMEAEEEEEAEAQTQDEIVTEAGDIDHVDARAAGNNVIITLKEQILFDTLRADIKKSARPVLDEIAKLLRDYPERMVIVAGHTDTMPVRTTRFPSNWDLSAQRAVNTVKYISKLEGLDTSRLVAAGFGEYHPIVANDSPENRRLNRRVEFILLPPDLQQREIEVPVK
ncbi:MAG: OmpA/MotB family protein [bacterium]